MTATGLPAAPRNALPAWLPPLPLAAAAVALLVYLGWAVIGYVDALAMVGARGTDFAQYYTAALMTRAHGWTAPYDVPAYMAELRHVMGQQDGYANLPAPTLLVMPLSGLPLNTAYALWNTLLVGAYAVASWAVVPGRGWARVLQLLASLAAFQVVNAIALGQLSLAVSGLVVLHWWLLGEERPVLAGIALGLAFVKPQNVLLVPVALALTGRLRAAAASVGTAAALGTGWLALLGPQGLRMYQASVAHELEHMPAGHYTVNDVLGGAVPGLAFVLGLLVTVAVCIAARGRERERPIVAGVLGSHLASPYLNAADLSILMPCAWLTTRMAVPRWLPFLAVGMNFLMALTIPQLRAEVVILQLVWLLTLAVGPRLGEYFGPIQLFLNGRVDTKREG